MGENSTNKTTPIGIIVTVISGILIAIATNPDVIKGFTDASIEVLTGKKEHKKHPQETSELAKFEVHAKSESGDMYIHEYTYPDNEQPAELEFETRGNWIAIPLNVSQAEVPRGQTDANGYMDTNFSANTDKPCPDINTGALVVKGENGKCLSGGKTGSFTAEPGKTYKFSMNDNFDLYWDNQGTITVSLSNQK